MNSLFKGTNENHTWNDGMRNFFKKDTKIEYIECTSRYDREQNAWISQIELNIENLSNSSDVGYTTEFELPEGCWISDYYLYVGDVKEKGILAEKKAATWVFNQIVDFKRDPGLLKYKPGNRIDFRVYPFLEREVRKTGIEFIHKEPLTINIDDFEVELGDSSIPIFSDTESENAVYISVDRKSKLPLIKRKPYYHFIVDISENSSSFSTIKKSDFIIERISSVLSKNPIDKENAKITYTNTYLKTENFEQNNWKEKIKGQKYSGGFFLDRALKKIIYDAYQNPEKDSYPVSVVVSDAIRKAVYFNDLANLQFAYPESDMFYSLSGDSLIAYKFTEGLNNPITTDSIKQMNVRLWKTKDNRSIYLPDNNKPSVVLNSNEKISNLKHGEVKEKNWNTGLEMQAQWMMQNLYPYSADKEWLTLIQNSFKSGIMTPLTSYIVVENKAQKAILKKKQDEALSGKRALDLNDNTERMSEPNIIIVLVLFAIFYWCHHRKKRKNTYHK